MTALTLPGAIPNLLRRGSPAFRLALGDASRQEAILVHAIADRPQLYCGDGSELCAEIRSGPLVWWPVRSLALDLTDATGRAHAAWWLALRECPASHVLDPAAVAWHPAPAQADAGWALEWQARAIKGCGTLTGHWWSGRSRSPVPTGLLWHLVRDDDTRLPDGSRWVDAEALRLVCLHVAGVQA